MKCFRQFYASIDHPENNEQQNDQFILGTWKG